MSLITGNVRLANGMRTSMRLTKEQWDALQIVSMEKTPGLPPNEAVDAFVQAADRGRPTGTSRTEAVRDALTAELFKGWAANRNAVTGDVEILTFTEKPSVPKAAPAVRASASRLKS